MNERDRTTSEAPLTDTGPTGTAADRRAGEDAAFYDAWHKFLGWMLEYAETHPHALFEKEADFPDYIYRMERPYDLPTTIMSASLSDRKGRPLLLVNASPRHTVFKEVVLHPFESHTYRTLSYNPEKKALVEGKRPFTREMLFRLADALYGSDSKPAE
jgi:hypothetical protein